MSRKRKLPKIVDPKTPISVERLTPTGQGIGTISDGDEAGKKIFLWNTLPGELVTKYKVTKSHTNRVEAIALEIENKNEHRVEPKDEQFLSTSPWQIMDDDFEIESKKNAIKELYRDIISDDKTIDFHQSEKTYFYRNKMEYALYYDFESEKILPAVHARGSHQKLPVTKSSIERPEIWQKVIEIIKKLNEEKADGRKYQSLLLRCNQNGEVSGGLYVNHEPHQKFDNLSDELLGVKYSYSPNGFFQINLPVYEEVLKRIKELLKDSDKVLDLYSGVGTIGLSVARDKDLTLVEVDKSAYAELENNTKGLENAKPILAKSEEVLDYITPDSVVILDPPRAGCDKKLIDKLLEVHPKQIIYLSCNPATQARDVKMLLESYKLSTIEGYNFFPKTPHIECLVSLA